jgi:hypothetical protein
MRRLRLALLSLLALGACQPYGSGMLFTASCTIDQSQNSGSSAGSCMTVTVTSSGSSTPTATTTIPVSVPVGPGAGLTSIPGLTGAAVMARP